MNYNIILSTQAKFIPLYFIYPVQQQLVSRQSTTWKQQIYILQNKHNISIESNESAINTLKLYSYYTLVNGYQRALEKEPGREIFIDGITIEQLGRIQSIESNISALLLHQIIVIEKHLKTVFQYQIATDLGKNEQQYLWPKNYLSTKQTDRFEVIKKLKKTADTDKRVSHSLKKYRTEGNVPPWILVNDITFGQFREWYSISPIRIKIRLIKEIGLQLSDYPENDSYEKELEFLALSLKFLLDYRNGLAHGDVLNKIIPRVDNHIDHLNKLYKNDIINRQEFINGIGKKDLYGLILLLGAFLPPNETKIFYELFESYIELIENEFFPITDARTRRLLGGLPSNISTRLRKIYRI
ncbi:Abi family protein [uncultured Fructobacillus sp.]|uniref:Abi family protein n=1 Tax=uncultured Fructobacillus sp. TaxID=591942 RepID=UPI0025927BCD|nr:Abi family protein [uncultured Fructobacillus sp.]